MIRMFDGEDPDDIRKEGSQQVYAYGLVPKLLELHRLHPMPSVMRALKIE